MDRTCFLIVSNSLVGRGGGSSRPRDKGEGGDGLQKNLFWALGVSVWSKNIAGGGGGKQGAPSMNPPLTT